MFKKLTVFILLIFPLGIIAQSDVRIAQLFNFGWKFQLGDTPGAESNNYNDSSWRSLDLPHDFQFEQPWDKTAGGARGFKAMGTGWYRKSFRAESAWKDKRVLLDFEGIMLTGDVWVNGQKVGGTDYGYLGFEVDVTKLLNYDGENVVSVRASTGEKGNSRWYTGGGLFRDVHLVIKNPVSIARHGVFITTPKISEKQAEVSVQVEVAGITGKHSDSRIRARIFAPDGKLVAETEAAAPQKSKLATVEVPLPVAAIVTPQLWSCEAPNLYRAEVSLIHEGTLVDQISEKFGIRTIEFSSEFGFKLNGKKIFLKGISNHHDLGALGAAVFDRAIERQFELLKKFGYNHVRTSHNPYSKSFLELADKHGILIVDELFDKWSEKDYWPGRLPFSQLWYKTIPEWIKRDRNHPSVILWSLGNELQMREDLAGFPTGDWGITTYKILDTLVKRYDFTRKTTVAMFPSRANAITRHDPEFNTHVTAPELSTVTEIASYNYRFEDYPKYLEQYPDLIVYQSEATINALLAPFYGMDQKKMVGLAYWGAIEYWGESNGWPKKGWNYSFFNHALEPYPQAYLIKSALSEEPLVHIGVVDKESENIEWNDIVVGRSPISAHWNRTEGASLNLFTYTNTEEVELLVNGKSMGVQKNLTEEPARRNMIYWKNVAYGKGGEVIAIARTGAREVARHTLQTTGPAVALRAEVEQSDWKANGMDLKYIKIYAVDSEGRMVLTSKGEVTFEVSGVAKLMAVDNGDHSTDALFSGNKMALHNGFALAILRSEQRGGTVQLKASMDGVRAAEIELRSE